MSVLPSDVYHLICEELANRRDFGTLFNCALVDRSLVSPALQWLYRTYNHSTIISSEGSDAEIIQNKSIRAREAARSKTFLKWAVLWRSIIRSSLSSEPTAYPYCLFIRTLDLRNLKELLEDNLFTTTAQDGFFAEDMAKFFRVLETGMKRRRRGTEVSIQRLDINLILELVGESVTSYVSEAANQNKATVALEDISGETSSSVLPTWISRLQKLKSMTLWDGGVLNADSARAVRENCYNFDDLTFHHCQDGADEDLASFFKGLRSNSLTSLDAIGAGGVGPATLHSMSHHAQSLKRLKLNGLRTAAIKSLSCLEECKSLESLELQDGDGLIDLEATENDIFLRLVAWISSCSALSELTLRKMVSGPSILTQVCLKNSIRLQKLCVVDYQLLNNQDFHRALSHQTSLESLELRADPEGSFRDDIDILINSISQLTRVKYLNLLVTTEYFGTSQILDLTAKLVNLEEFWFAGYGITDDLWHGMVKLPLRALNIHAITSFSVAGIIAFLSVLQKSNQGLYLSVSAQTPEVAFSDNDQETIRCAIRDTVEGTFDFTLHREDSETDEDSD